MLGFVPQPNLSGSGFLAQKFVLTMKWRSLIFSENFPEKAVESEFLRRIFPDAKIVNWF
jgi:hypothetical protein